MERNLRLELLRRPMRACCDGDFRARLAATSGATRSEGLAGMTERVVLPDVGYVLCKQLKTLMFASVSCYPLARRHKTLLPHLVDGLGLFCVAWARFGTVWFPCGRFGCKLDNSLAYFAQHVGDQANLRREGWKLRSGSVSFAQNREDYA